MEGKESRVLFLERKRLMEEKLSTSSLVTQKNQQSDLQMYMGRNQHRNAQCINNRPTNHERKRNATQTRISCGTENLWPVRIRVMK